MPGKAEKGPAPLTRAQLMRQAKSSRLACGGWMASWRVLPPPFF